MPSRLVIVGAGFAGVWSALSAKRLIDLKGKNKDIEITVIAPEPSLVVRPRLYEANAANMSHPLGTLFDAAGVRFFQGLVEMIQPEAHTVHVRSVTGTQSTVDYDRLILAAGSSVVRPRKVTGLQEHAFDIDTLDAAVKLETHFENLPSLPESSARNTIIVCGAGFTGIELATELPKRLSHMTNTRIIVVDNADEVGSTLGPGPRPIITKALGELGIEAKLGSPVTTIDPEGLNLTSGERIKSKTVIWTAGVRATPLTQQIPGPKDALSRVHVNEYLQAQSARDIFVTGDAAYALADTKGHYAMMSCQHALPLGRVSGHNAAAELLGEPMVEYSQAEYVCCLDLGAWGTVVSHGWDREVKLTGDLAKRVKGFINQKLIYPPNDVQEAIDAAGPFAGSNSNELFEQILQAVA